MFGRKFKNVKRGGIPTEFPSGAKLPYVRSKESEQSIMSWKSEFSLVISFIIIYMEKLLSFDWL